MVADGQDRTHVDILGFHTRVSSRDARSQRTTVTVMLELLQRSGLIEYSRGHVRIVNREELESAACDCYRVCRNLQAISTGKHSA